MKVNYEAEISLIGDILLEPAKVMPFAVQEISPEDFSNETCKKVYEVCVEFFKNGSPIDIITVSGRFSENENAVYRQQILKFCESTPTTRNFQNHIALVSNTAKIRRTGEKAQQLLDRIQDGADVSECQTFASEIMRALQTKDKAKCVIAKDGFMNFYLSIDEKKDYLKTGIPWLDNFIYADKGDFIIVGGRPSSGKTAFTLQMAAYMAQRHNVVYFSLETNTEKIYERLVAHLTKTSLTEIKRREIKNLENLSAKYDLFTKLRLSVVQSSGWTVEQIRSQAVQLDAEIIFIDYISLLKGHGKSMYEKVTNISMDLHTMAQQMGITIIALTQLNRSGKETPDMTSLRESGQIEQDADAIILINRPDDESDDREIIIAKNKEGKIGMNKFNFSGSTQTFSQKF